MRRNGDQIVSRRGQKYELDRASWTTYRNFKDMYVHNYAQMEVAGVAKLLGTNGRIKTGIFVMKHTDVRSHTRSCILNTVL